MTTLWIDDQREKPPFYDRRVATVEQAISFLDRAKKDGERLEIVSFDAHAYLNWTFRVVAEWMRDNDFWPGEIRVHTYNNWFGRPWFEAFFHDHAPASTIVDMTDPWRCAAEGAPEWVFEFHRAGVKING